MRVPTIIDHHGRHKSLCRYYAGLARGGVTQAKADLKVCADLMALTNGPFVQRGKVLFMGISITPTLRGH